MLPTPRKRVVGSSPLFSAGNRYLRTPENQFLSVSSDLSGSIEPQGPTTLVATVLSDPFSFSSPNGTRGTVVSSPVSRITQRIADSEPGKAERSSSNSSVSTPCACGRRITDFNFLGFLQTEAFWSERFFYFLFFSERYFSEAPDANAKIAFERIAVNNFVQVPIGLEKVISLGFLICADQLLYLFTFLPTRIFWAILQVLTRRKSPRQFYFEASNLSDLMYGVPAFNKFLLKIFFPAAVSLCLLVSGCCCNSTFLRFTTTFEDKAQSSSMLFSTFWKSWISFAARLDNNFWTRLVRPLPAMSACTIFILFD